MSMLLVNLDGNVPLQGFPKLTRPQESLIRKKTATKAEVTSQQVWGALLKEEARESHGEEVCFISREPASSAASDQGGRFP